MRRAFATALLALLVVGCGGGGGETVVTVVPSTGSEESDKSITPGPTVAEFRTDADAVCTGIERRVQRAYDDLGGQMVEGDAAIEALKRRADIVDDGVRKLRRVATPTQKRAAFNAYIGARQRFADAVRRLRQARIDGDAASAAAISDEIDAIVDEKIRRGRALGLNACGDRLPRADVTVVDALVEQWVDGRNPESLCSGRVSETYLQSEFGGDPAACVKRLSSDPPLPGGMVSPAETTGVETVHATADAVAGPSVLRVFLQDDSGTWKIDGMRLQG